MLLQERDSPQISQILKIYLMLQSVNICHKVHLAERAKEGKLNEKEEKLVKQLARMPLVDTFLKLNES